MLTYAQFVAKHPRKFKGLTKTELQSRYQDYVRSADGGAKPQGRRKRVGRSRQSLAANSATVQYLQAVANPFTARAVSVPTFPCPPSAKLTAFQRGTFSIGTNGFGFVGLVPTAGNDNVGVVDSNNSYAGNNITSVLPTTGLGSAMFGSLPYGSSAYSELGLRSRIVLCGIRVRYTGTQNNMGGSIYPYVNPMHATCEGFTIATIQTSNNYRSCPVTQEWVSCVLTPVMRHELDYHAFSLLPMDSNDAVGQGGIVMFIAATGTPGNTFEFEVVQHVETLSTLNNISVSESPTADIDFMKVADELNKTNVTVSTPFQPRDLRPVSRMAALGLSSAVAGVMLANARRGRDPSDL